MSTTKTEDAEWVLLEKLRQLIGSAPAKPASGKVDGGKESQGPVAGNASASAGAKQTVKTDDVSKLSTDAEVASPSSSPTVLQPSTENQLVPNNKWSNPLLSAATDAAAAAVLRFRLATSLGGSDGLLKRKHHYVAASSACAIPSSTGAGALSMLDIAQGDTYSARLGNAIRVHHITVRVVHERTIAKQSTGDLLTPMRHSAILRDKVPLTVGTAPSMFETGTNPPEADTTRPIPPFNNLGTNIVSSPASTSVAVRNPMSEPLYDFIHYDWHNYTGADGLTYLVTLSSNGVGAPPPYTRKKIYSIPCDFIAVYPDTTTTPPMLNALWWYCWIDQAVQTGYTEEYEISFDVEFSDVNL